MDAVREMGQDTDGRKGNQHGPNDMTRDPSRDHQEQAAGAAHEVLHVEGHAVGDEGSKNN